MRWSRRMAKRMPSALRAVATRATPGCGVWAFRRRRKGARVGWWAVAAPVKGGYQLFGSHLGQPPGVGAHPDELLGGVTRPEVRGEAGPVALLSRLALDDQAGKDAVQVAQDLVLEGVGHLDLGEADTVQVLHGQVDVLDRLVRRALTAPEEIANGGHIGLVGLLIVHQLLVAVLGDRPTVGEEDVGIARFEVPGQVLEVVAGGLQGDEDELGLGLGLGGFNSGAQPLEAGAKDVNLEGGGADLPVGVVDHDQVEVLADVQGDAQDASRIHAPGEAQEGFPRSPCRCFRCLRLMVPTS